MHKLFKPLLDAWPTAHPRRMEAVDPLFERVKPFFDQVSLGIVKVTAQSNSEEGSPIAVAINEKHSVRRDRVSRPIQTETQPLDRSHADQTL